MKIQEVMTPHVEYVSPDKNLAEAAKSMRDHDIGALPVGENDRLIGMITDRDIAIRAVAEGLIVDRTSVRDVMTKEIFYAFEDNDVEDAARLMKEKKIRRLVILNRDKRLVGVVSLCDIVARGGTREMAGDVLETVAKAPATA